jgi:hypothetical protein
MATVISTDISTELLARFRGVIAEAWITYPERAAFDLIDADGGKWHLTTWWSDFSPEDPAAFSGKTVVDLILGDEPPRDLTLEFSDGSDFKIVSVTDEEPDPIHHWELFTPEGRVLDYGPGDHWHLGWGHEVG